MSGFHPDDPILDHVLGRAWSSFATGNHGVGAAVLDANGTVAAAGHNRIFDDTSEVAVLSGSPLAHAEVNALYSLGPFRTPGHVLLTSLAPCPLCMGAATVMRISEVRYLGHDPSCTGFGTPPKAWRPPRATHQLDATWSLWCEILPLVSAVQRHGTDSILAQSYRYSRPDLFDAAQGFAESCSLNSAGTRDISFSEARVTFRHMFAGLPATQLCSRQ